MGNRAPSVWAQSVTAPAPKQWLGPSSTPTCPWTGTNSNLNPVCVEASPAATCHDVSGVSLSACVIRDGTCMEVQVDIESKPSMQRHHSGGSSVEDAQHSTCPPSKMASSSCPSGKQSKTKLRRKGGSHGGEMREDMEAQLLGRRRTNSSEFDPPSLSGSLPSVAESHCSRLSSELSCSDPESGKGPGRGSNDCHPRMAAVSPLPEVEHDRLENCPPQAHPQALPPSPEVPPLCFVTEESVNLMCSTEQDPGTGEPPKEENNNRPQLASAVKNACIQTEI